MSMKRYVATSMQAALKQIREDLGADAVILSTQKVEGGVEVICALEEPAPAAEAPVPRPAAKVQSIAPRQRQAATDPSAVSRTNPEPVAPARAARPNVHSSFVQPEVLASRLRQEPWFEEQPAQSGESHRAEMQAMRSELQQLRELIRDLPTRQSAQLVAREKTVSAAAEKSVSRSSAESRPVRKANPLRTRLRQMGFSPSLADRCIRESGNGDSEQDWQLCLQWVSAHIPISEREPLAEKGVHIFLGAAGAGKTTTIAKLAARYTMQYGADRLALVTSDRYRIAGARQLQTIGQLLKVEVITLDHRETLDDVLDRLGDKRLVLVDTAGLSPSEESWQEQNRQLQCERHRVQKILVLPASSQTAVLKAQIRAWKAVSPSNVILTKVDETWALGEALGMVIAERLPLSYITDGQQVSAHIHRANARNLVSRLLQKWQENESWQQSTGGKSKFRQDLVI